MGHENLIEALVQDLLLLSELLLHQLRRYLFFLVKLQGVFLHLSMLLVRVVLLNTHDSLIDILVDVVVEISEQVLPLYFVFGIDDELSILCYLDGIFEVVF